MPAILLIGSSTHSEDAKTMLSFQDELLALTQNRDLDATVDICYYDEVSFEFVEGKVTATDHHNGHPLEAYDLVIFKGSVKFGYLPYAISRYLTDRQVAHFNDYRAYRWINKLAQFFDMAQLGLPMPRTIYLENSDLLIDTVRKDWQYPLVLKSIAGSKGTNNYLVKNEQMLRKLLAAHSKIHFVIEEYVPNDGDYRILVIDGNELILRRASGHSYLNNTSQGAQAEVMPAGTLPGQLIKQAHTLAEHLTMQVAGVDVIQDKNTGKFYFLEINAQPAISREESRELLGRLLEKTFTNGNQPL